MYPIIHLRFILPTYSSLISLFFRTSYSLIFFFFSSRRRHTILQGDWSSDVCSSDLTMVRRYDDGPLAGYVSGDGSLELTSEPAGAEVTIARFEDDEDGVLRLGDATSLGTTPLAARPLAMGSYLCILRSPNCRDVRYPVHITRNRAWRGAVTMRAESEIGEGFVCVPGGPFVYGEGRDAKSIDLADFAIAASPVTLGDWAVYL